MRNEKNETILNLKGYKVLGGIRSFKIYIVDTVELIRIFDVGQLLSFNYTPTTHQRRFLSKSHLATLSQRYYQQIVNVGKIFDKAA